MTDRYLPNSFALQSAVGTRPVVTAAHVHAGGVAVLVQSARYPRVGRIRIDGLLPGRHYILNGAAHRFVRTELDGAASIDVRLVGPTLVTMTPVI